MKATLNVIHSCQFAAKTNLNESFNISIFWNDSEAVSNISLTVEFDFSIIRDLLLGLWDILDILDTLDLIQNG